MATIDINDYALMNDALTTRHLVGTLYGGEYQAHRFLIRAVKDGAEQNLTGVVTARFLRKADDPVSEVVLNGSIIGGKASVTLAQSCYAIPGRFELTIFLTQNGSKTALYSCAGIVRNTSSSPIIDPGQIVPDVDDILAQYQMMVDATENADAAAQSATYVSNYTRTLTPGNFTLTYDGYLMQAESAVTPGGDPKKAVKQEAAGWSVYTYEFGYNALIRIDKLVKNSNVAGVIPMAIRRWTGRDGNNQDTYAYYALDYDRTAQLFVGDQLMLNHVDPNGFALDYIGVSMITNYNFNDVINCTDHIGQFDSVIVFGDSIFAGYMPWDNTLGESHIGRGVCQQVADTLGLPMTNYAVPGAYLTTQDTTFKPVIQQVVDWTPTANTTPLILIDGGTNDRYNNELTNFGEYSERDVNTIYGAIMSIVEWLFTKGIQPWQIVLTTPIPNAIRAINVGDQITFLEHINTQLAAISFAYHMIGAAMGVNVINGWRGPFSELGDQYPKQILLPDDVHPSEQGAAYYADYICRLIGGKSTKVSERLAYSAAQPFVKGNVSEEGRVFLALAQEDFTPYHLGAVLKKNGDTVSEVDNNEWDIYSYKYFMNQNFSVRMDSLTLNPGVANVLDSGDEGYVANFQHMAYQRIYHNVNLDQYQATNYPIGTSDAGKTVETCAILVNRRRKDGALAIKDVGITVNAKRDFEDMIVCQNHLGEFDSVVVFGDSIFANHLSNAQGQEIDGHLTNSGVMDRFAALLDLPQENHAEGGATLSAMQMGDGEQIPYNVWQQVGMWTGPETGTTPLVMINGGTNDMRLYQLCNMGSYSHIDPIEIYGGLCKIIENLEGMGIQPWQIVVNTPIPKGFFADVYNLTLFDAQLTAIGYAMYEVCLKYGVSVINGYRGPFSNVDSTALKQKLMPDSTHPSADGAGLYARHIYRALCSGGSGVLREDVSDVNATLEDAKWRISRSDFTEGIFVEIGGNVEVNPQAMSTDYIDVDIDTVFHIATMAEEVQVLCRLYDANKAYVSTVGVNGINTRDLDFKTDYRNIKYVRFVYAWTTLQHSAPPSSLYFSITRDYDGAFAEVEDVNDEKLYFAITSDRTYSQNGFFPMAIISRDLTTWNAVKINDFDYTRQTTYFGEPAPIKIGKYYLFIGTPQSNIGNTIDCNLAITSDFVHWSYSSPNIGASAWQEANNIPADYRWRWGPSLFFDADNNLWCIISMGYGETTTSIYGDNCRLIKTMICRVTWDESTLTLSKANGYDWQDVNYASSSISRIDAQMCYQGGKYICIYKDEYRKATNIATSTSLTDTFTDAVTDVFSLPYVEGGRLFWDDSCDMWKIFGLQYGGGQTRELMCKASPDFAFVSYCWQVDNNIKLRGNNNFIYRSLYFIEITEKKIKNYLLGRCSAFASNRIPSQYRLFRDMPPKTANGGTQFETIELYPLDVTCTMTAENMLDGTPSKNDPAQIKHVDSVAITCNTYCSRVYGKELPEPMCVGTYNNSNGNARYSWRYLVLKGTENWAPSLSIANCYFLPLSDIKVTAGTVGICCCSHYVSTGETSDMKCWVDPNKKIGIRDSDCADLTAFKAYLSAQYDNGTPVILAYELAEVDSRPIEKRNLYGYRTTTISSNFDETVIEYR